MDGFGSNKILGEESYCVGLKYFYVLYFSYKFDHNFDPNYVPMLENVLKALPGHISLLPWLPEIFNKILRSFELPVGEAWKKWGPAAAPMATGSIPGIIIKYVKLFSLRYTLSYVL